MTPDQKQLEQWLKLANQLQPLIWADDLDWELREFALDARLAIFEMVHIIKRLQRIEEMLRAELNRFDDLAE